MYFILFCIHLSTDLSPTSLSLPPSLPPSLPQVLAWDRAMAVWKSAKYWGHVATVAAYALTCVLPSPKKDGGKKA